MIQRITFIGFQGSLLNCILLLLSHSLHSDIHRRRQCGSWQIMYAKSYTDAVYKRRYLEDEEQPINNTNNTAIIWYSLKRTSSHSSVDGAIPDLISEV